MPDLKNKYSDPELNPANKDFDEIVDRPDIRALNDQGDAVARDLADSENGVRAPQTLGDQHGKDAVRATEKDGGQAPENRFNYQKSDTNSQGRSGWSRRRKILTGVGAGGGIAGIMVSLFMLLPLKVPGVMQMISDEAGQRVEQITEKRAKVMIARYIVSHTLPDRFVITGEGAVSDLMRSMRAARFERKLEAKGITFERSGDGVKISVNNEALEGGRALKSDIEVLRALEGTPASRKVINNIVKEEIPSWRWMKRAKFAKWLRIKYGIPRYGIENSTNPDEEARIKEMNEARLGSENGAVAENMGRAVNDLLEGNGDLNPYDPDVGSGGTNTDIEGAAKEAADEVAAENSNPNSDSTQKIVDKLAGKLGSKVIPIIGWIDLAATINHIVYETSEHDLIGKIATYYRAMQYSRHYGVWSGYGSQIQLGAMDPAFIGALASQTEGIEESQAFNMIEGNPERGEPVKNKINANNPTGISEKVKEFTQFMGGYDSLGGKAANVVLEAWYDASNKIFGAIGDVLGGIAAGITPDSVENWMATYMKVAIGKLMDLMGLDFDPSVKGADWFNAAHGGATWTYNDFCKVEMGCRKLTPEQTAFQNTSIATERASYRTQQGVMYALFDTESSRSAVSRLAVHTPTNAASLVTGIGKMITDSPTKLLGLATKKTSASAYVDIHGVDPYGALASELNAPLNPQAVSGQACEENPDGKKLNLCQTDTMVAEAMVCEFDPDSEDCAEGTSSATGEASEFTVASYNILDSEHHKEASIGVGGCKRNPVPGDPWCAKTRTARQVKIITGTMESASNPAFDIVGTQENSPEQYQLLKSSLASHGYSAYPDNADRMNHGGDGRVAIYWNNAKFTKVEEGKAPGISNIANRVTYPWVGLQTSAGHKIYAMSIHYSQQDCSDGNCNNGTPKSVDDANMRRSSELTMDWVRSKATGNNIVIVMGDFNDKRKQQISYCIFTERSITQHAVDMAAGTSPDKACPSPQKFPNGIDHIYATPKLGLTVSKWERMAEAGEVARASDHPPFYATYQFPAAEGDSSGGSVGNWSWPVDERWWKSNRADFLDSHSANSGTWTSGVRSLASDISSPSAGQPVYAMLGGTVSKADLGGHGLAISSNIQGGTLEIAYAHGPRTSQKTSYSAGEKIMTIGSLGNSTAAHLHVDMAFTKNGVKKGVCPQDIFLAMGAGQTPDLAAHVSKAKAPCGR